MNNQLDYEINKELGECYLFMRDYDKAEGYYQKACEAADDQIDPILGLATIAVQRGDFETAATFYTRTLDIQENDKALAGLGLIKMETGFHAEAFDFFEKSLASNAGNMIALNCLVREGYQLQKLDRVLVCLEKSLISFPESTEIRVSLAGCLISLGRHDEARAHLEAALINQPENVEAKELFAYLDAA